MDSKNLTMPLEDVYSTLERDLPAVIARTEIPRLLGGLISAGRLANLDSEGLGPRQIRLGRKIGYLRSDLVQWMRERSKQAVPSE
ncbi:MAG: hypothetical protein RDU24_13730 [Humidesulfovibrio sp.]|uniref:hypothetical protein n=1 Tax=Humidesulfovibrio sp. TaxID=2910988 RepID=UPI0027F66B27|nr:hypothetical protein [Humidesulfovibrio sp.]MDQ7836436.1 hypothetical protein [Humidesulfovibrio sp.]